MTRRWRSKEKRDAVIPFDESTAGALTTGMESHYIDDYNEGTYKDNTVYHYADEAEDNDEDEFKTCGFDGYAVQEEEEEEVREEEEYVEEEETVEDDDMLPQNGSYEQQGPLLGHDGRGVVLHNDEEKRSEQGMALEDTSDEEENRNVEAFENEHIAEPNATGQDARVQMFPMDRNSSSRRSSFSSKRNLASQEQWSSSSFKRDHKVVSMSPPSSPQSVKDIYEQDEEHKDLIGNGQPPPYVDHDDNELPTQNAAIPSASPPESPSLSGQPPKKRRTLSSMFFAWDGICPIFICLLLAGAIAFMLILLLEKDENTVLQIAQTPPPTTAPDTVPTDPDISTPSPATPTPSPSTENGDNGLPPPGTTGVPAPPTLEPTTQTLLLTAAPTIPAITEEPTVESTLASTPSPTAERPAAPPSTPVPTVPRVVWELVGGPYVANVAGETGYGNTVVINESVMAVGARFVLGVGGVLTYNREQQQRRLQASESDTFVWKEGRQLFGTQDEGGFGAAIALSSNNAMLIGAPYQYYRDTTTEAGAAFYYEFNDSNGLWEQIGSMITGENGLFATDEEFGLSLAVSNNRRLIIGAPNNSFDYIYARGRVYTFEWYDSAGTSGDFVLQQILIGKTKDEGFGSAVDISQDGSTIVVGAPGYGSGYAVIYELIQSEWTQVEEIMGSQDGENMGASVKCLTPDGSFVAVGASNYNTAAGRVVIYRRDPINGYVKVGGSIVGFLGEQLGRAGMVQGSSASEPGVFVGTSSGIVRQYKLGAGNGWVLVAEIDTTLQSVQSIGTFAGKNVVVGGEEQTLIFES